MADFLRFWAAAFRTAWADGRAFLRSGAGKAVGGLVVVVFAALGLRYAEAGLAHLGVALGAESIEKELLKALAGVAASAVVALALVVAWAVLIAPAKLWSQQTRRAACFPFGVSTPLFGVKECWWTEMPVKPATREAYLILEFRKEVKEAQLKVWGYHNGARIRLIHNRTLSASKGEEVRLVLATVFVLAESSHGGSVFADGQPFNENELKLVRLEMTAGKMKQEYRVVLGSMHTGDQRQLIVVAAENNPYFWSGAAA